MDGADTPLPAIEPAVNAAPAMRKRTRAKIDRHIIALRDLQAMDDMHEREDAFLAPWQFLLSLSPGMLSQDDCINALHNISYAFSSSRGAGIPPRTEFMYGLATKMQKWESKIAPHFAGLKTTDWTDIFAAYARMRIVPGETMMDGWRKHSTAALGHQWPKVQELSLLMAAFGRLLLDPGADFARFARLFVETADLHALTRRGEYSTLMCAAAWMDAHQSRPEYRDIARICKVRCHNHRELEDTPYNQVRDACLWFGLNGPVVARYQDEALVSRSETRVAETFRQAGLNVVRERSAALLPLLHKSADMVVRTKNGRSVFVEFDGPYHFNYLPGSRERYNGPTVFQQALAKKTYPGRAFLRLPYFNYDTLMQTGFRRRLGTILPALFDKAARMADERGGLSGILSIRSNQVDIRILNP